MPGKVPREVTRQRETEAWRLRQGCWTEARIAAELGVSQQAVSKILARVAARVLKELDELVEAEKVIQLDQLHEIAHQAMRAWERSLEDGVTVKETAGVGGGIETTTKGQSGNPALLAQARGALADIRDLLGLNAKANDLSELSDEELLRRAGGVVRLDVVFQDALGKVYGPNSPYGPADGGALDSPVGVKGRAGLPAPRGP